MSSVKWRPFCLGLNVLIKRPLKLGQGWVILSISIRTLIVYWWKIKLPLLPPPSPPPPPPPLLLDEPKTNWSFFVDITPIWQVYISFRTKSLWKYCLQYTSNVIIQIITEMFFSLINWGRVTHIPIGKLIIPSSDNGLLPGQCQAIIWTTARILLIGPLGTNFSEILIGNHTFSFKKMHLKMASAKWRPFCLSFNVLTKP